MNHSVFTIITPVRKGEEQALSALLESYNYVGIAPSADPLCLKQLEMLHYASLFIYHDPVDGHSLVFECNIDGDIDPFLNNLIEVHKNTQQAAELLSVYQHCTGFEHCTLSTLKDNLVDYITMPSAEYVGAKDQSCKQILLEKNIYDVADEVLKFDGSLVDKHEIAREIKTTLDKDNKTKSAWRDIPPPPSRLCSWAKLIILLPSLLFEVLLLVIFVIFNLPRERSAPEDNKRPDPNHVLELTKNEDLYPTNHMVSVVHLHDDFPRLTSKKLAFDFLNLISRYKATKGRLGSIPTIHFAHWTIVNNGRRLLFVSNFDGSWQSYLDDFVLKAHAGLTLAWCHGKGFPRSSFMFRGGAKKGPEFIDWARRSMVPTQVWYSAYNGVSVANIRKNTKLRKAIIEYTSEKDNPDWLTWV